MRTTTFAASLNVNISSVYINSSNTDQIDLTYTTNSDTSDSDGKVYFFEIKPYQKDLAGRHDPLVSTPVTAGGTVSFKLNAGPGEKRVYSAFVAAVKKNFRYEVVSNRCYVLNPEILAANTEPAKNEGKKGIVLDASQVPDALSLNVKHVAINVPTQNFFGSGISYSYEGRQFQISAAEVENYDNEVKQLTDAGCTVTAILLNGWNKTVPELNRPGITELPKSQAQYYAFNVETEDGFRAVKAMASFLAHRYNGLNGHGKITNWVIGNEINNQYWNYVGDYDVQDYVRIFQRSFRAFYTAIKMECANDNVMFSIDQYWNAYPEAAPVGKYTGRSVLEWFNEIDHQEGSIDWGLALHPYPYKLNSPVFWDGENGRCTDNNDSPIVNFSNLKVATDFMQNKSILNPKGEVRTIFLTEEGFSSQEGSKDVSQEQAAAVAYSYYIAYNNPYIDAYIMSRQLDSDDEIATAQLAFGLSTMKNGTIIHKPSYYVYKEIDDPVMSQQVSEFAKPIIGITDWNEVIPGFKLPE